MRRKQWVWAAIIVCLFVLGVVFWSPYLSDFFYITKNISFKQMPVGERTLFIAPHPDDEAIGGAGTIQKALAAGKQVKVVMLTDGDGFRFAVEGNYDILKPKATDYQRMAIQRHLETIKAMKSLGLKSNDIIFLGYQDGGLSELWGPYWEYNHLFRGLNGRTHSPYSFVYEKYAPYCGLNLVKNLEEIILKYKPTDIVYPDPYDNHPDHYAANAFIKYILTKNNLNAKLWTYLAHRGDFPIPWLYEPNHLLYPPRALRALDANWLYPAMSRREKMKKHTALLIYKTQTKIIKPYLEGFVRRNELIGVYRDSFLSTRRNTLIRDPKKDTIRRELDPYADIIAVHGVLANNQLSIGVETSNPVKKSVTYHIRIRSFSGQNVKRMDAKVYNGHLSTKKYASNSIDLPKNASAQTDGNTLWMHIPISAFAGAKTLMVSADTTVGHTQVDKVGWQVVHLP